MGAQASHCLMDGSSLFGFLKSWGCLCREEAHGLRDGLQGASRAPLRALLKNNLREVRERGTAVSIIGEFLHRRAETGGALFDKAGCALHRAAAHAALQAAAALVPRMLSGTTGRERLVIPNDKLQALKTAA